LAGESKLVKGKPVIITVTLGCPFQIAPQYSEICASRKKEIIRCQVLWQAAAFKVGLLNDPVIDIFILPPVRKSYSTDRRCVRGTLCFSIFEICRKEPFFFEILLFSDSSYIM